MDAAACPDMSVARSVSVELDTSMAVDFDDCSREIQDTAAAMLELANTDVTDNTAIGAARVRNPSYVCVWKFFPTNPYLQAGLTYLDEIWNDGRS